MKKNIKKISSDLNVSEKQVENTIKLLSEGATIPFISRYRKEWTNGLNEVEIDDISRRYSDLVEFQKRKEYILKAIDEQNKLSQELKEKIDSCESKHDLEDIYLPYKSKRKTKGSVAKEKGLFPLANEILSGKTKNIREIARTFLSKEIPTIEDAFDGAKDIIAEYVNENVKSRKLIRFFLDKGSVKAKVIKSKQDQAYKYKIYFDWEKPVWRCTSYQVLAILRGREEGFLRIKLLIDDEKVLSRLNTFFIKTGGLHSKLIKEAVADSYKRLLFPSLENEFLSLLKEKADKEAIEVFSLNLKQLLLDAPLGNKKVLAIDPGYRTGCKFVCLNEYGDVCFNDTIYPNQPQNQIKSASKKIIDVVSYYNIEAIAIGNGTASRETESFVRSLKFNRKMDIYTVSEDGASIYSASKIAREEFPEYDITVRGAVSIGRRLMDPLAELVKIDPKSIGVGQYQHDVNPTMLKNSLDRVVEYCVNFVGVNVNTASKQLLMYVSGIGSATAQNIVNYRTEHGQFNSRDELLNIPRFGQKVYEQSAGFLRIMNGYNILDSTGIHPETYSLVKKMADYLETSLEELISDSEKRETFDVEDFLHRENIHSFGKPTLENILKELNSFGADPRKKRRCFEFDPNILSIEDLKVGMTLPGIIENITQFGAFVNIGIKESGLIHKSEMSHNFVSNPNEILHVNQQLQVRIINIDLESKRIQLSIK